jgi:uncharacterized protein YqgV (UPF0045/DUF77 family)
LDVGVEISLYPLTSGYRAHIHALLERLAADGRFRVETSSMSTQIFGSYEDLMTLLQVQMKAAFEELGAQDQRAVFVLKVLGPLDSFARPSAS